MPSGHPDPSPPFRMAPHFKNDGKIAEMGLGVRLQEHLLITMTTVFPLHNTTYRNMHAHTHSIDKMYMNGTQTKMHACTQTDRHITMQ